MSSSSRREELLARFRLGSLARVEAMLAQVGRKPPYATIVAELRAPLHTLKGEARMLGLVSLAGFVHALEDTLADSSSERGRLEQLAAALGFVRQWLDASLVEDREAELRLERGRALLTSAGELAEPARAQSSPVIASGPTLSRVSLVSTDTVDSLCERLEELRSVVARRFRSVGPSGPRGGDVEHVRHELAELAELAWSLRLVPVEPALESLANHARALAAELGKQAKVVIDAGGVQLERSLLERLHAPLMHLVNNAIDHGIEAAHERGAKPSEASLTIAARSLGQEVELELVDDGRGVDLERIRRVATERGLLDPAAARRAEPALLLGLLFEAGFSTSTGVGELSGRGVGLDVVRRTVEGLGGDVTIDSRAQVGTRFVVRVPATLSRETVLVVEIGGARWGLASRRVGPIVRLDAAALRRSTVDVDGEHVPLLSLARLLGVSEEQDERIAICCSYGGRRYALACQRVLGEHELFRRSLGPTLASICLASSSAIMDDGALVLLLEPAALLDRRLHRRGRMHPDRAQTSKLAARARVEAPPLVRQPGIMVVDDSAIVRELLGELLRGAAFEVTSACDGREALALLGRRRFDLVLADIEMPYMDGFALLERIRELDPELPVVMLTTRGSDADRQQAAELGANAYLVKSEFREQKLLDTIARFVEVPA